MNDAIHYIINNRKKGFWHGFMYGTFQFWAFFGWGWCLLFFWMASKHGFATTLGQVNGVLFVIACVLWLACFQRWYQLRRNKNGTRS